MIVESITGRQKKIDLMKRKNGWNIDSKSKKEKDSRIRQIEIQFGKRGMKH